MIKIYQTPFCPFCIKVKYSIKKTDLQEGRDFEFIDAARGTPGREEVIRLGGQSMVPFLVDGDVKMYESSDIIAYIKKKFS